MSILPHCSHIRAAFSGEVEIRCISLNHSHCSAVASGIYKEVHSWRNVACSFPQPRRMSVCKARSALPSARVCAIEH